MVRNVKKEKSRKAQTKKAGWEAFVELQAQMRRRARTLLKVNSVRSFTNEQQALRSLNRAFQQSLSVLLTQDQPTAMCPCSSSALQMVAFPQWSRPIYHFFWLNPRKEATSLWTVSLETWQVEASPSLHSSRLPKNMPPLPVKESILLCLTPQFPLPQNRMSGNWEWRVMESFESQGDRSSPQPPPYCILLGIRFAFMQ